MYQPLPYDLSYIANISKGTNEKIISLLFTQNVAVFRHLVVILPVHVTVVIPHKTQPQHQDFHYSGLVFLSGI